MLENNQTLRKIHNKLFPDELDYLRSCKHLGHVLDTRLNIPERKILIVSTPKGIDNEKVYNNFI